MNKYISFGVKIAKVGPVDPEIIWLWAITKKEEINASKIYTSLSRFAQQAKLNTITNPKPNSDPTYPAHTNWSRIALISRCLHGYAEYLYTD